MRIYSKFILPIIIFQSLAINVSAQDIESVVKSKAFEFSGNLSAGFSYNYSSASVDNFAPFSYRVMFNPTVTIKGFTLPFAFTYMDNDFSYSKPTVRLGFNPKYKWVQVYTGSNTFNLSPFTFSGQNVTGVGLHLTPGKLDFLAFYGKIKNFNTQRDTLGFGSKLLDSYDRKTIGLKVGYKFDFLDIELSGAKIEDDTKDKAPKDLKPMENAVIGAKLSTNAIKNIRLGGEIGISVITEDKTIEETTNIPTRVTDASSILPINPNESSRLGIAGSTFLDVTISKQVFGIKYKRVETNFRSLGLFYINNDYQNITFNTRLNFVKGKIRLNGSIGRQNNNLDDLKTSESIRTIGSVNGTFKISKPLTISARYTNQTQDRETTILSTTGSREIGQTSENLSINPRYIISNKKNIQSYTANFSRFIFKRFIDRNELEDGSSENNNLNANYSYSNREKKWGVRVGANYFSSIINDLSSSRYGLTLGYNKSIKTKLRLSLGTTFNLSESDRNGNTTININRANISYKIGKKQSLNLSLFQTNGVIVRGEKSNDFRMNFSYALNF